MKTEAGMRSAQLQLSKEYVQMYGEIGSKSNTMLLGGKAGDVSSLVAQASLALESMAGKKTDS